MCCLCYEFHWRIQDWTLGATSLPFSPFSLPLPLFPFLPLTSPSLIPFPSFSSRPFYSPPLSPFTSLLLSSLPSLPLEVGFPWLRLGNLGKRILVHFRRKFAPFWVPKWRKISCVCFPLKECENYWELRSRWALYFSEVVLSWGQSTEISLPLEVL